MGQQSRMQLDPLDVPAAKRVRTWADGGGEWPPAAPNENMGPLLVRICRQEVSTHTLCHLLDVPMAKRVRTWADCGGEWPPASHRPSQKTGPSSR